MAGADLSSDAAQRLAETQDAIVATQYVDDDEVEASVKRSFEQLRDAFAAFDADGDGKLTEDEVVAALTRKTGQGTELSGEAARATWRRWKFEFDLNDDGKISIEELARAKPADQAQDELIEAGMTDWEMHEANDEI